MAVRGPTTGVTGASKYREAGLVEEITAQPVPPVLVPADCVAELRRLQLTRERADVQRQMDRLLEQGIPSDDERINQLGMRQLALKQQIDSIGTEQAGSVPRETLKSTGRGPAHEMKQRLEDTPLSIEEKYDEVRQLISIGKEKGTCSTTRSTSCCPPTSRRRTSSMICSALSAVRGSRLSTRRRRTATTSCSTAPVKEPRSSNSI